MRRSAEDSLAYLYTEAAGDQEVEEVVLLRARRRRPVNHAHFVDTLYERLDRALKIIEDDAHLVCSESEDQLTSRVVMGLKMAGYRVLSNAFVRGHVDLVVESFDERYRWLGESKCFTGGYGSLDEGFLQLQTRYMSGRDPHAGLIIFVKTSNGANAMREWSQRVEAMPAKVLADPRLLTFRSLHTNPSGLEVELRHMGTIVHFEPMDKSARASAKKKQAGTKRPRKRKPAALA